MLHTHTHTLTHTHIHTHTYTVSASPIADAWRRALPRCSKHKMQEVMGIKTGGN